MTLRLGDTAPDFEAETTEGKIKFHEWKDGSWAVLFSHPADFTPVCTTELGRVAALKDQFAHRNTKVIDVYKRQHQERYSPCYLRWWAPRRR